LPARNKIGTTVSSSLTEYNCKSRETMLRKLAMENTEMEAEVSRRMLVLRCVRWYKQVKVLAIDIQAGSIWRGDEEAPHRYMTQDVR